MSKSDPIEEAFKLTMASNCGGHDYVMTDEMLKRIEAALPGIHGELFARAAVSLVRPLLSRGRVSALGPMLHKALGEVLEERTRAWLTINLAQVHFACGQPELALSTLDKLERPHVDAEAGYAFDYARTLALRGLNRHEESVTLAREAMERARRASAHYAFGILANSHVNSLIRAQRLDEALSEIYRLRHHVSRHEPENTRLSGMLENALPAALLLSRRYEEAASLFEALMTAPPEDEASEDAHLRGITAQNLAVCYLLMGDLTNAARVAATAQELVTRGYWRGGDSLLQLTRGTLELLAGNLVGGLVDLESARGAAEHEQRLELATTATCIIACARHARGDEGVRLPPLETPLEPQISANSWAQLALALEGETFEMPVKMNYLEQRLFNLIVAPTLLVKTDFSAFSIDGGADWVVLTRRVAARSVLRALVNAAPHPVDAWSLFEEGWPDETVRDANAINKLYTTIHRMRGLGLDDFIETVGDGYALKGAFRLVETEM